VTSDQRIVLVTGGSRGIGAATAELAASRGFAVCVNYRDDAAAARAVVERIEASGGAALAAQADVSDPAAVERLFEAVDAMPGRLHGLVNNAGITATQSRVDEMGAERLRALFATNVIGAFLCAQQAVRRMSTRYGGAGGSIVNVSSAASRLGSPGEYVDYAATKGALDTFTLGLALEVAGEGIRVNGVRPGFIDTEIHAAGGEPGRVERLGPALPMQRGGTAHEIAEAVHWLLSDSASYATRTFIELAGGA
jgi:NAD(P)-dependent dehydrogenase (short-subunit alcohol dehydrogenase family)